MTTECQIQRYAAYFKGWCQAFGEHESVIGDEAEISWLLGDDQVGLILPQDLNKSLYREALGKKHEVPTLRLSRDSVRIGKFEHLFLTAHDKSGFDRLRQILNTSQPLHLFLTYHFMYQQGTRIVTFSRKAPLNIIYKTIGPMNIQLL
ncbi:MAG: hypothetical protein LJE73_08360 [Proteobacteria bacterium]|jgi:hypothetical protein|nr:hypothetical protein [Pseudomonadota bacterium]